MRTWFHAVATALAFAALGAPSASAQESDYEAQVRGYLEHGMAAHEALGYRRERNTPDVVVPLAIDGPHLWTINLRAGVNYRVYGACDDDCADLDMEIYGADGNLVDRDTAIDDVPYVQITPTRTGPHFVRVWVYACDAEPCYSGARLMTGGTPTPRVVDEAPTPQTVETDEPYLEVVRSELDAGGASHEQAGYARFGDDAIEPITLQGDHRMTVSLERRRAYVFQGACDQDCTDVNMEILDARGRRVAVDEAADDRPSVAIAPGSAGDFTVRAWLVQCSVEPCYVGVRGYRR